MNKATFITELMNKTGLDASRAQKALKASLEIINDSLAAGEDVQFVGFGTFSTVQREPRIGRNPKTGEQVEIPSKRVIKFTPGTKLKAAVN